MFDTATTAPATGRDLLPSPDELHRRLAANIQEARVLRGLLKIVEKDTDLRESARRFGVIQATGRRS